MRVVLPLKQHVGAPCVPIVNMGDDVKRGTLLAKPNGLGANIHASVTGKVVEVSDTAITLEYEGEVDLQEYVRLSSEDKLGLIEEAGIVGAGGAGFPTFIKYKAKLTGGYVIANAAECEPLLEHNMELLRQDTDVVLRGLQYVMELTGATHGYVAIKPIHKVEMIQVAKAAKNYKNIEVKFLPTFYPAGDERVIVREILGIELPLGALPSEANAVISNIETLKNVTRAIEDKMPVMTKDITIAGRVKKPQVFMNVPLGSDVKTYIDKCGGYVEPHGELVLGGPFTGQRGMESSPITKTLGAAIVAVPFTEDHRKFGILECECGAQKARLTQIVESMGGEVVGVEHCKRMEDINGRLRCTLPGVCPGQAEKVLALRKKGAEALVVGTCED